MATTSCDEKLLAACDLLSKHGTLLVIRALLNGARRQVDILRAVPRVNAKTLSKRLLELEDTGIVIRTVYPEMPVRIEYRLTRSGATLADLVRGIEQWASK